MNNNIKQQNNPFEAFNEVIQTLNNFELSEIDGGRTVREWGHLIIDAIGDFLS